MKIEPIKKDETELHALKQFEKKKLFIGSKMLRPGHRCFEINNITKECCEAKYETEVHFNKPNARKVITKEGYSYVNALNQKNAIKVFNRSI